MENEKLIKQINETIGNERIFDSKTTKIYKKNTYFLFKNYLVTKSIRNLGEMDILIVCDNLAVNAEIVDLDNVNDYEMSNFDKNKILNDNKILLLNYYDIKGNFKKCRIFLDAKYNVFKGV